MSNTGLEEKVEKMNVEEKEAKGQKGSEKTKGDKKRKEDLSAFPLEVSELRSLTLDCMFVSLPVI